jgi:amphi-Trp domain-containing protein
VSILKPRDHGADRRKDVSDKNKFGYADKLSSEEAAETIESLARALKEGRVSLRGAGQAISLVPSDTVKMKIEADAGSASGRVAFSISWKPEYARSFARLSANAAPATAAPDAIETEAPAPVDEQVVAIEAELPAGPAVDAPEAAAEAVDASRLAESSTPPPPKAAPKPRKPRGSGAGRKQTRRGKSGA